MIQLLSHATVFVCPSIYEPLGIVNLEAMACEAAVVATRTGGIPEVVDGRRDGPARALRASRRRLARAGRPDRLSPARSQSGSTSCSRPPRAERFGKAGRRRAVERFNWAAIAAETVALYERLL